MLLSRNFYPKSVWVNIPSCLCKDEKFTAMQVFMSNQFTIYILLYKHISLCRQKDDFTKFLRQCVALITTLCVKLMNHLLYVLRNLRNIRLFCKSSVNHDKNKSNIADSNGHNSEIKHFWPYVNCWLGVMRSDQKLFVYNYLDYLNKLLP